MAGDFTSGETTSLMGPKAHSLSNWAGRGLVFKVDGKYQRMDTLAVVIAARVAALLPPRQKSPLGTSETIIRAFVRTSGAELLKQFSLGNTHFGGVSRAGAVLLVRPADGLVDVKLVVAEMDSIINSRKS